MTVNRQSFPIKDIRFQFEMVKTGDFGLFLMKALTLGLVNRLFFGGKNCFDFKLDPFPL